MMVFILCALSLTTTARLPYPQEETQMMGFVECFDSDHKEICNYGEQFIIMCHNIGQLIKSYDTDFGDTVAHHSPKWELLWHLTDHLSVENVNVLCKMCIYIYLSCYCHYSIYA